MSEIPEGATHKNNDKFYKKGRGIWFCYHPTGWFCSHTFSDGISAPTPIKQDKEMPKSSDIFPLADEYCESKLKQDKEMSIDFKDKAFALENKPTGNLVLFDSYVSNGEHYDIAEGGSYSCKDWTLHTNKEYKKSEEMIYTKQMQEAGEFCRVGMMFETEAGQYKSLFQNETSVVFEDEEMFLVAIPNGQVKSIDTRTDKEKAIDDLGKNDYFDKEQATYFLDDIKAGKIHGITFTGDK